MASSGLLRPITPAPQAVARTNQIREAECSLIEAEDKESAKGERFETYHLGLVPEYSSQGKKKGNENCFGVA